MEFVNRPFLTKENVEKEKGIIVQELQMYADHPDHRIHTLLLENLYHEHPVRLDIGGTVESVQSITVEDLFRCYNTFYQPNNLALAVVGDVDPKETLQIIEANYPAWTKEQGAIERLYPEEPRGVKSDWVEEQLHISQPRYLLGFKHEPLWQERPLEAASYHVHCSASDCGRSSISYGNLWVDLINDSFERASTETLSSLLRHWIRDSDPDALHAQLRTIIDGLKAGSVCK